MNLNKMVNYYKNNFKIQNNLLLIKNYKNNF